MHKSFLSEGDFVSKAGLMTNQNPFSSAFAGDHGHASGGRRSPTRKCFHLSLRRNGPSKFKHENIWTKKTESFEAKTDQFPPIGKQWFDAPWTKGFRACSPYPEQATNASMRPTLVGLTQRECWAKSKHEWNETRVEGNLCCPGAHQCLKHFDQARILPTHL